MKLSQIAQTKVAAAAPVKFVPNLASHDSFVTAISPKAAFQFDVSKFYEDGGIQIGDVNNTYLESFTAHGSSEDTTRDIVNGNGGFDYISTGGGNDIVTVGNNTSAWRGTGNEFTLEATSVDVSSGNDRITVDATRGAFHLTTGEGSDTITVRDADYVKIDCADGDSQLDIFIFEATFGGTAEIYGADNAWHDQFVFEGGGTWEGGSWSEVAGGINNELAFYNDDTGGTVIVHGSSATSLAAMPTWHIEMM